MLDVKWGSQTQWRFDAMPKQVLDIRNLRDNGQDQIVQSENYSSSSIMVAFIDENKNTAIERLPWLKHKPLVQTAYVLFDYFQEASLFFVFSFFWIFFSQVSVCRTCKFYYLGIFHTNRIIHKLYIKINTHTHTHIYIYIYRERERQRQRQRDRDIDREKSKYL